MLPVFKNYIDKLDNIVIDYNNFWLNSLIVRLTDGNVDMFMEHIYDVDKSGQNLVFVIVLEYESKEIIFGVIFLTGLTKCLL